MIIWYISFLLTMLALSGLFSAIETAYTALSPGQISALAENRGKRGRLVKKLIGRPEILLTTLLLGNNLANIGAASLTASLTIQFWGNAYLAVSTGILTMMVLVFCEVTPKQIALRNNENICLHSARSIQILSWIFRPVILVVTSLSRIFTHVFTSGKKPETTLEYLLHHVKTAEDIGLVKPYEEDMIRNIFRINDRQVKAIMTHRTDLFTVNGSLTVVEAAKAFMKSGFTSAPVIEDGREQVQGVVSQNDLVKAMLEDSEIQVEKIAANPLLVPGTMKAHELFSTLKKEHKRIAVVLDEYGGLNGVVTREDIMEEIFDSFSKLYDLDQAEPIKKSSENTWLIRGDADFYDVNDVLGLKLIHGNRTHTMGGYIVEKMGKIPIQGATIELSEGTYEVLEIHRNRVASLRFRPHKEGTKSANGR